MDNGRCTLSLRDFLDVLVTSESNIKDSDVIELSGMSEQNMNLFTGARINSPRSNLKNGFVSGKCIVN